MNEYLIYTTQGVTIAPNEDVPVENCQLLGRSSGESFLKALENLYKENHWISEAGFGKSECIGAQVLSTAQREDISKVINYLWKDELKYYQESEYSRDHIFRILARLRSILK